MADLQTAFAENLLWLRKLGGKRIARHMAQDLHFVGHHVCDGLLEAARWLRAGYLVESLSGDYRLTEAGWQRVAQLVRQ